MRALSFRTCPNLITRHKQSGVPGGLDCCRIAQCLFSLVLPSIVAYTGDSRCVSCLPGLLLAHVCQRS